jgi:hypothetical protein
MAEFIFNWWSFWLYRRAECAALLDALLVMTLVSVTVLLNTKTVIYNILAIHVANSMEQSNSRDANSSTASQY